MTEDTIVILAILATLAVSAIGGVVIQICRRQQRSGAIDGEVCRTLDQILAQTLANEKHLIHQRGILCDAHRKIHTVSKTLEKRPS